MMVYEEWGWVGSGEGTFPESGRAGFKGDAVKRSPASSPRLGMLGEAQKEE